MSTKLLAGRYELIEKIGEGGMAIVYKAKCRLLNRYVAIKILRPEYTKDTQFIENFRRESQAAAALNHANIVGIYDVGQEGNIYYIVMELIDGKPLSKYIAEKGRLDYKEAIHITRQVALALSLAHKNQIIHRDVKSHNILITNNGIAKLADFGIAKAVSASTIIGGDHKVMGSVHYFSPEQARGAYVDERSDIYSLGIVLYEMLTGKVPFDGDNPISIALMHINDTMPQVTSVVPGIPPQLEKIIMKATEKYQSNRYKNVDELLETLDNLEFITKVMGEKAFFPQIEKKNSFVEMNNLNDGGKNISRENRVPRERKDTPEKEKKLNPMKVAFITLLSLVVIGGGIGFGFLQGWFGSTNHEIEVPSFTGKTFEQAQEEALELGITIEKGGEYYSPDQDAGKITTQEPSSGAVVTEGKVVIVNISKGKKDGVMPKVVGMDLEEARSYLETFGFSISMAKQVTSNFPENVIISQSISPGTTATDGTSIDVEVSDGKGKEMVKMPNIIGKTPDEANSMLSQLGLTVGIPTFEETNDTVQNLIFWQQYPEGKELEKGTEISYKVSKGIQPEGSGNGTDYVDPTELAETKNTENHAGE